MSRKRPRTLTVSVSTSTSTEGEVSASKRFRRTTSSSSSFWGFVTKIWYNFWGTPQEPEEEEEEGATTTTLDQEQQRQVMSATEVDDDDNEIRITGYKKRSGEDGGEGEEQEEAAAVRAILAKEPLTLDDLGNDDEDEVELVKVINPSTRKTVSTIPTFAGLGIAGRGASQQQQQNQMQKLQQQQQLLRTQQQQRQESSKTRRRSTPTTFSNLRSTENPGVTITTAQKKSKERRDNSPESILGRLKNHDPHDRTSVYENIFHPKLGITRRAIIKTKVTLSSPRRGTGGFRPRNAIGESVRLDEKAKYRSILSLYMSSRGSRFTPNTIFGSTSVFSQSISFRRSPLQRPKKQAELVTLDDDDEELPVVIAESTPIASMSRPIPPKSSNDADVVEILNKYTSPKPKTKLKSHSQKKLNTLDVQFSSSSAYKEDFLKEFLEKYSDRRKERDRLIQEETVRKEYAAEKNRRNEVSIEERIRRHLAITDVDVEVDVEEEEEEIEEELPEITEEMQIVIKKAICSRGEVLVDAYNISITRKDIDTLKGLNWLNDEIINFYLQMIVSRSNGKKNFPKVYATNTFFYPKLMQCGHNALKRWTRKVDIFDHDLILIPVHLGMHWCLATIDFRTPGVYYYDSMGGENTPCLTALKKYLEEEHMDKKKTKYDTSNFETVTVKDMPQQMNGSDCGMFACKTAEYLSRNAKLTFSQENMPYFRRRMIYEIVTNTLFSP